MLSLIEKAEQAFDEKKAEELQEKMLKNKFDLNDYLENMQQVKNMGPIDKLLGMIPGVDQSKLKDVDIDEKQIAHVEAIIYSMTMKERTRPEILNASRKRRIAAGSGRSVEEINKLLKGFDQAKEMMKRPEGTASFGWKEDDHYLTVSTEQFSYTYNKFTGLFEKMCYANQNLLDRPMELNIWRAPTDNDFGAGLQKKYAAWKNPEMKLTSLNQRMEESRKGASKEVALNHILEDAKLPFVLSRQWVLRKFEEETT